VTKKTTCRHLEGYLPWCSWKGKKKVFVAWAVLHQEAEDSTLLWLADGNLKNSITRTSSRNSIWAGGVAQVKCLPAKPKTLSSKPQCCKKKKNLPGEDHLVRHLRTVRNKMELNQRIQECPFITTVLQPCKRGSVRPCCSPFIPCRALHHQKE
jgi:hypothetical protein